MRIRSELHHSAGGLLVALISFCVCARVEAQSWTQYDQATPPQHASGVSPFGSYVSTEIGTVSLTNGALNIHLPLATVGGRGFSIPISLNYSSKVWSVAKDADTNPWNGSEDVTAYANYGEAGTWIGYYNNVTGTAGWSIGGMPVMTRRFVGVYPCDTGQGYQTTLTKLSAVMPDGSEIEFRDDVYDGAPRYSGSCTLYDELINRGLRWHATDGSGAIFIYDNSTSQSGVLITGDGTHYRFDGMFGPAVSATDRNGNQITVTHPNGTTVYTDQLGRTVTIANGAVTFQGYQGTTRTYQLHVDTVGNLIRSDLNYNGLPILTGYADAFGNCYQGSQPPAANYLFPSSYCRQQQRIDTEGQLSQLDLPDGRSLSFKYNLYGEVAEVTLPTGAKLQYDYSASYGLPSGNTLSIESYAQLNSVDDTDRVVTQRRTYADGTNLEATWTYVFGPSGCSSYPCVDVKAYQGTASSGTLLLNQRHYFLQGSRYLYQADYSVVGTGYSLWSTGLEKRTETRDASNNVIGAVEQDWSQRTSVSWPSPPGTPCCSEQIQNDNRVDETRRYLDNGNFAKTDTVYDNANYPRANNVSESDVYDYDGSLKRRSTINYVTGSYQNDDSIHLLSLPVTQTIYDGNWNQLAQSTNEYDNYAGDGNHAPLLDYGTVVGHDGNYNGSRTARGNLTASGQWLNTNNSIIYSYLTYDILGNALSHKDPQGNTTTISYADDFGDGSNPGGGASGANGPTYALPTLITSPPPQSGQPQQTARSQYDFFTGLLTGFKDRNSVVTQTIYNDPLDRPTMVKSALGISGVESHAVMYYAPATAFGITLTNNDVLTARDQTSLDDSILRSWTHTDGFGRTVQSFSRDPQGDDKVATIYDALGRVTQTSNPFRPSLGENAIYTTTAYDLAGRVTSVTTPDSAVVLTSYSANTVTVTDQAGKQRESVTDGLGRLVQVYEAPNVLNYLTNYSYDTLDDLTGVSQYDPATNYTQTRSFNYDSLKRLTSATNPESGRVCYGTLDTNGNCQANGYDANGNLVYKTDARGVVSTYAYDALNRNTSITHSDGTPTVGRVYDGAIANGTGRLYYNYTWSANDSTKTYNRIDAYDALGRVKDLKQHFWLNGNWTTPYAMTANYDLAGHMTSMTYPSQRTVNYTYDNAGRTSSFTGNLGAGGASRNYSTGISYSALGGMNQEQLGTTIPIYNKLFYNSRGQLAEIREGLTPNNTSWQRGAIINFYDTCWGMCGGSNSTTAMPNNNGNLKIQQVFIPQTDAADYEQHYDVLTQYYEYDSLNRLQFANEASWKQQYTYDRYGNRTLDQANTFGNGIPNPYFSVDQSTNRLTPAGGYTMHYDAAGNLDNDNYTGQGQRNFDAENRMTAAWSNGQWQSYIYDADGRRVRRIVNGAETWQVYGISGELIAEYAVNGNPLSPQKEYGYRNGQLLITAAMNSGGWGPLPSFDDNPLVIGQTPIRSAHITQLRTAIDALRSHYNLGNYPWQVPAAPGDAVSIAPIQEMRNALDQALGPPSGGYASGLASAQPILKAHIQELRDRILAAWQNGSGGVDLRWLVADQLGTPRMMFDQSGSLATTSRHDYLPFGEELFAGTGGRTPAQGYGASDGVRNHFTGYERDSESGLDYAHARYYASMQGRFASPDPYVIMFEMKRGRDAEEEQEMLLEYLMQPQNWAKYNYGLNNPLNHTDPTGMRPPTRNEQNALNELDQLADKEGDTELGRGLRAARNEIAHIIDGLGRGQQNVGINIAVNAILNIGNSQYADSATVRISTGQGTIVIGAGSKCNVLVGSAVGRGAGLGFIPNGQANSRGYPLVGGQLPAANWLGDAQNRQHLTNLAIVTDGNLRPGDIVAWRYSGGTQDGHSSIYIGGGVLVYAGSYDTGGVPKAQTLNFVSNKLEGYWGGHDTHVVRRYNGKP